MRTLCAVMAALCVWCASPGMGLAADKPAAAQTAAVSQETKLVDLNTATSEELQEVRGIGPALAGKMAGCRARPRSASSRSA